MKDYKISALADTDMRQYEFTRNSRLPRGTFDSDAWYRRQDCVVFGVCCIVGAALLIGIVG
jgi:hypothetical protein